MIGEPGKVERGQLIDWLRGEAEQPIDVSLVGAPSVLASLLAEP